MKNFSINIQQSDTDNNKARIVVYGFLDAHTIIEFDRKIDELLKHNVYQITLDLQNLTYISSAGIAALMALTQQCRQNRGDLYILKPQDKVMRILELLGFTRIFNIYNDDKEIPQ